MSTRYLTIEKFSAASGAFRCSRCGAPAGFVSVSAHLRVEPVWSWRK